MNSHLLYQSNPLLGKSAKDPVAANLLTVFLTGCLCIASHRAISVYCNQASTIPNIFLTASWNCKLILFQTGSEHMTEWYPVVFIHFEIHIVFINMQWCAGDVTLHNQVNSHTVNIAHDWTVAADSWLPNLTKSCKLKMRGVNLVWRYFWKKL